MNNNEILMYELEDLASYNPEDIDNPEIEVCYENAETGADHFQTLCLVDLGTRALSRLRELEGELKQWQKFAEDIKSVKIGYENPAINNTRILGGLTVATLKEIIELMSVAINDDT